MLWFSYSNLLTAFKSSYFQYTLVPIFQCLQPIRIKPLVNKGKFLICVVIGTKYLIAIFLIGIYTIDRKSNYYFPNKTKIFSEVIIIDIEIKKRSIVKEFLQKLHSQLENLFFKIIMKLPDRFIPSALMNWLDRYTTKRINQLKQQNIKQTWRNLYLQSAVDDITNRQQP